MRVALLLAVCILGCGRNSRPTSTEPPPPPTPVPPTVFEKVEVRTITTGARLDPDGYSMENDPWDYDVGDGMIVKLPTNGTVVLSLRTGSHILYLFDVAKNCTGVDLDRSINVQSGTVTSVVFTLQCADN